MSRFAVGIGELAFKGLIGNKTFAQVGGNEFINALQKIGWDQAHNAHIFKRLKERGPAFGIDTPNDFARALRDGETLPAEDGAKKRVCDTNFGRFEVIYREETKKLITFRHPSAKKNESDE